jgi:Protein of unknown function (DUF4254)
LVSAEAIVALHDERTRRWHEQNEAQDEPQSAPPDPEQPSEAAWLAAVTRQHRANFDLWHIEDEARAPNVTDASLAAVKRCIDRTNQLRNDLTEELDRFLMGWLDRRRLPNPSAPLNSESPGLIVDRLSVLALKIYHTQEEVHRPNAPAGHMDRNRNRLAILEEQRSDLAHCLDVLWRDTLAGARRFKMYRQLKMYNDPALNPAVYAQKTSIPAR